MEFLLKMCLWIQERSGWCKLMRVRNAIMKETGVNEEKSRATFFHERTAEVQPRIERKFPDL